MLTDSQPVLMSVYVQMLVLKDCSHLHLGGVGVNLHTGKGGMKVGGEVELLQLRP